MAAKKRVPVKGYESPRPPRTKAKPAKRHWVKGYMRAKPKKRK